ncbi:unnamed protein product [Ixodes persulcatus]
MCLQYSSRALSLSMCVPVCGCARAIRVYISVYILKRRTRLSGAVHLRNRGPRRQWKKDRLNLQLSTDASLMRRKTRGVIKKTLFLYVPSSFRQCCSFIHITVCSLDTSLEASLVLQLVFVPYESEAAVRNYPQTTKPLLQTTLP